MGLINYISENAHMAAYLVVGLAVVCVILLVAVVLLWKKLPAAPAEKFGGANNLLLQRQDQTYFGHEGYMQLKEHATNAPAAPASPDATAVAAAIRADLAGMTTVGSVDLGNCKVSSLYNADPWLYVQAVSNGQDLANMSKGALQDTGAKDYGREGLTDGQALAAALGHRV